ncbi:MAG: hypothetical protein HS127_09375 [Planctomycetia bacterium]|nr:hypothetical protein [Planctomycetia bacterium]
MGRRITPQSWVLWDSAYLYIGMEVLDDNLYNDSTYVHEDDSVEIYIDGDHNHGTTYDSYDRQFIKGWNDETLFEKRQENGRIACLGDNYWRIQYRTGHTVE